jgi:hypothetical protein
MKGRDAMDHDAGRVRRRHARIVGAARNGDVQRFVAVDRHGLIVHGSVCRRNTHL